MQALDRQSSGKDVKESVLAKSEVHITSPFAKKEAQVYVEEIRTVKDASKEMPGKPFEHVSGISAMKQAEVVRTAAITQKSETVMISMTSVQVITESPPKVLLQLQDLTVRCGDTAQFICALESENFSSVLWSHEGVAIQESERAKLSQNGSVLFLTLVNVQLLDQGLYSCSVRNNYGEVTTTAILTVEGDF